MALPQENGSTCSKDNLLKDPFSCLTMPGESLFMCSSKENHVCYHGCQRYGRYPLWSDTDFMEDDVTEDDEEEDMSKEEDNKTYGIYSDEEWMSDEDDGMFGSWTEIDGRRRRREHIIYDPDDLKFIDDPDSDDSFVGVIASKPPPEYVWHLLREGESWMRGSLPERVSDELDDGYRKYRYRQWDEIPDTFTYTSDDDDDDDDDDDEDEDDDDEDDDLDDDGNDDEDDDGDDIDGYDGDNDVNESTDEPTGQDKTWSEVVDEQENSL